MCVILRSCDVVPQVKTDPADVEVSKVPTPLTTYGRDEKHIQNRLHLLGASSVILDGVGDGMITYCCLTKRIPCLMIFDKRPGGELHQKIIHKFLVDKVKALMEAAVPGSKWYRTNTQLGCREEKKDAPQKKNVIPAPKKQTLDKKKDPTPAPKILKEGTNEPKRKREGTSSGSEDTSGSSSSVKSKQSKKSKK